MATRTLRRRSPIPGPPSQPSTVAVTVFALVGRLAALLLAAVLLCPLVLDQLVEPAHLALAGLQAHPMQFARVAVDLLARPGQGRAQAFPAFLDLAPAALQDAH